MINRQTPIGVWSDEMPAINLYNYPLRNNVYVDTSPPIFPQGNVSTEQLVATQQHPTLGTKYDGAKPRMDLLDASYLEGVAEVLTFGANKYDAHNWRGGIAYGRLIAAAMRHLMAINKGEDIDPESGLPHVYHLGCNAMFLSWMMKNKPELDDRYKA